MKTREIRARSILSRSAIDGIDYCVNPYVGCSHGCTYCYASFMKRFTGHREPWGSFVDVKTNAPALLERELGKARRGTIMLSSVTDPYQPLEATFRVTRACLRVLAGSDFPVHILTKSPLVRRDVDLLKTFKDVRVGITITTGSEAVRRVFEPRTPPISARIEALERLHGEGLSTYAFIGPVLPLEPEALAARIAPFVERVLIDAMNYPTKTVAIYRRERGFEEWLDRSFVEAIMERLKKAFAPREVVCC
jgi:DNA repair photolyase